MSNTTAFVRDNFDSISEGCFLVMPSKKRKLDHEKPNKKKIKTKEKGLFMKHGPRLIKL
ncbi:hypothetical protein RO3G_11903 [Rhizopus delemar RA 99-880]|uniref:Uncharacterized protein n=1 Tax=Rhizopus delemar (strain RA 99-880 / ATCC MYA-4621 / FGSC 9543 / NRRL 43880) TaxID=246409 RepID=I1CFG2_RHIO9|nr:hypothetical protein RO3G_11903 [Rhizopus delemar RA 99-880]|eukprot:EIE87192.1 hypothetical protein RO3G_11903 [Rhizopus delemar RA 99-880]